MPANAPTNRPAVTGKQAGGIGGIAAILIAGVIAIEGGYVNDKADPGGETNMGVTKRVAVANGYVGPMRSIPRSTVESIYYRQYFVAPGYEPLIALDAAVTEELFDTTVNMGPGRPSTWFQRAINLHCGTRITVDGRVGPGTVRTFGDCQQRIGASVLCLRMLTSLDGAQRAEYDRLVRVRPPLRRFHRGWINHRIGNVDRAKCSVRRAA